MTIDLVSSGTALDQTLEELAAAKVSLADTAASLLNSVGATVKAQQQRDKAQSALARVEALLGDQDGPLWAVRGVREPDIRAAIAGPS